MSKGTSGGSPDKSEAMPDLKACKLVGLMLAHPQFSLARIARRGGRWMRNPGGKGFCREPRRLSAKEGGVEGLPQNLG